MTKEEYIERYRSQIPSKPGVYKYYDSRKRILYVGKAKNLKKRINSYFTAKHTDKKTIELVKRIESIDYHIAPSENEALLLENNLIKNLRPPFNINLKDNKNYYPSIVILDEDFPRVFLTRNAQNFDIATKYGPFTYASSAYSVMDYISEHYKLRTCSLDLSADNIASRKYRACLQYHIKKCKAPCVGYQTLEEYDSDIDEIKKILSGQLGEVQKSMRTQLKDSVDSLDFEKADQVKKKLQALENYQSASIIDTSRIGTADVIDFVRSDDTLYFTYFYVENGKLISANQNEIKINTLEDPESALIHVLLMYRKEVNSKAQEVIIAKPLDIELEDIKWTMPKKGIKKKLLEMAHANAELLMNRSEDKQEPIATPIEQNDVLQDIQDELNLNNYPENIECFDNSNIQGTSPVAAMVRFHNGKPDKSNYRKYNIKTVEGPDDFKSMHEVVYRRYKRLKEEYKPLPDLIIIDGGKGQLSAAYRALVELEIAEEVDIIGLAKKKEEIFIPNRKEAVHMAFNSPGLLLIRRIRDEVHRFGIRFHRKKRSQNAYKSKLDDLKGVGPKSKEKLLRRFKTLENISKASLEDLEETVNKTTAKTIYNSFRNK